MLRADIERFAALRSCYGLAATPSRQPSIEVVSTHRFQSNFAQGAGKEQADAAAAEDAMIRRYLAKQAQAIASRWPLSEWTCFINSKHRSRSAQGEQK